MKNILLLIAFTLLGYINLNAQHVEKCGFQHAIQHQESLNPQYKAAVEATFNEAKQAGKHEHLSRTGNSIFRIPVVVHVVYNNSGQDVSDSLIHSQIEVLNNDFRRLNEDAVKTREMFDTLAGDSRIEFFLAEIDPDGNPTTGITRTQTTESAFDLVFGMDNIKFDSLGGKSGWPSDKYLNIWIGNLTFFGISGGVMGYAYPPVNAINWDAQSYPADLRTEGVVLYHQIVGKNNPGATGMLSSVNLGRSATHEVGHYLGLRHIWGDGPCSDDDGIDDTPRASSDSQSACNFNKNTCVDAPFDYPDMLENYMDYAADSCLNMFTKGQIEVMRGNLLTTRAGLAEEVFPVSVPVAAKEEIRVYPNPTQDFVAVNIDAFEPGKIELNVYNIVGQSIFSSQTFSGSLRDIINLLKQPGGMYIFNIETPSGIKNVKVVKH